MPEIVRIENRPMPAQVWAAYEKLLPKVGTEEFGSTVRDCVATTTAGARRIYLFEATGREHSDLQYHFCEPSLTELLPAYTKHYIQLDPVWDAYRAVPATHDMALLRICPHDIASAGFRRRFFDDCGILERLSIIQRGPDLWRVINLARHKNEGYFSDLEVSTLVALASLVLPMLPLNRARKMLPEHLTVDQLENRFAKRFDTLTRREREVCARAAIGMSVEATALDLHIAKTSVLTYRRRAYQRLKITSPYELCSLVTH
ncbi:MAG: LuxR C-terminal-related transcriptional regulator [Candidatus Andeanibacterium colombiense]|uniref:LuxR C-terminal-related transcriptional regulator n=1 Tax=Candidatus Andeanibacterium colombiense TaxID=3121345 RepID=A0AAJ6BMF1_9SPHN|nr:MAG: LuxR C-terminal-related transcriptional regulator [Sphingomonadaceae bacterium]